MMSMDAVLTDAAYRLLETSCDPAVIAAAESGAWPAELWGRIVEAGFVAAARREDRGGVGLDDGSLHRLAGLFGRFCLPLPVIETWLAEQCLAEAGLPPMDGPLGLATTASGVGLTEADGGWRVSGALHGIPWGRHVAAVVAIAGTGAARHTVVIADPPMARLGTNLAGEPRDAMALQAHPLPSGHVGPAGAGLEAAALRQRGAVFRCLAMSGAMDRMLELVLEHVTTRVQFGRPIGKFQAVQQSVAMLAAEVTAARSASDAAAESMAEDTAGFRAAAAKIRCGEAATQAAAVAHQLHGAMGFTREFPLNYLTRRLWSWRDEFGTEAEWARSLGDLLAPLGGEALWPFLMDPRAARLPHREAAPC